MSFFSFANGCKSSDGGGSSVAVAVARMGSGEGVASGREVGSVPSWGCLR